MTALLLLAHGADPRPLPTEDAVLRACVFLVFAGLVSLFTWYRLWQPSLQNADSTEPSTDWGWQLFCALLLATFGWWLFRTVSVEMSLPKNTGIDHTHTPIEGGQVVMWWDFHAEISRVESGELRVFITDSYDRRILSDFYRIEVLDETAPPRELIDSLDSSYRYARLPREQRDYRIRISTPGWSVVMVVEFDESRGRRSLPLWCGTR